MKKERKKKVNAENVKAKATTDEVSGGPHISSICENQLNKV
jgi:hypothetical protein